MSFEIKEPILIVGLGGAGSRLALQAKDVLGSDCLLISNDQRDLAGAPSVHVSTGPVINPSMHLVRGSVSGASGEIRSKISGYSTVVMMSNLAGKAGSAIAPAVSDMCRDADIGLVSFAIMPFKYEKDRIFNSGTSLKRVRENSQCTIVLDNDALLESNPDLTPKACHDIANSAIMHVVGSLGSSEMSGDSILATSRQGQPIEDSLRDSLKMLYEDAPPNAVKRSMLYVVGGSNIPAGVLNSVTCLADGILDGPQVDTTSESDESGVVMVSSVQEMAKFDGYDPLGIIPQEDTLDWSVPDCSIGCELDLYQLE